MSDPIIQNTRQRQPDKSWHRSAHCPYCDDTGWVELAGTEMVLGVEYPRGVTACRWCQEGIDRYTHGGVDSEGRVLESNYDASHLAFPPTDKGYGMTFEQYQESERGKADPNVPALVAMLKKRKRMGRDDLPARAGQDAQLLAAAVKADDPFQVRKADV